MSNGDSDRMYHRFPILSDNPQLGGVRLFHKAGRALFAVSCFTIVYRETRRGSGAQLPFFRNSKIGLLRTGPLADALISAMQPGAAGNWHLDEHMVLDEGDEEARSTTMDDAEISGSLMERLAGRKPLSERQAPVTPATPLAKDRAKRAEEKFIARIMSKSPRQRILNQGTPRKARTPRKAPLPTVAPMSDILSPGPISARRRPLDLNLPFDSSHQVSESSGGSPVSQRTSRPADEAPEEIMSDDTQIESLIPAHDARRVKAAADQTKACEGIEEKEEKPQTDEKIREADMNRTVATTTEKQEALAEAVAIPSAIPRPTSTLQMHAADPKDRGRKAEVLYRRVNAARERLADTQLQLERCSEKRDAQEAVASAMDVLSQALIKCSRAQEAMARALANCTRAEKEYREARRAWLAELNATANTRPTLATTTRPSRQSIGGQIPRPASAAKRAHPNVAPGNRTNASVLSAGHLAKRQALASQQATSSEKARLQAQVSPDLAKPKQGDSLRGAVQQAKILPGVPLPANSSLAKRPRANSSVAKPLQAQPTLEVKRSQAQPVPVKPFQAMPTLPAKPLQAQPVPAKPLQGKLQSSTAQQTTPESAKQPQAHSLQATPAPAKILQLKPSFQTRSANKSVPVARPLVGAYEIDYETRVNDVAALNGTQIARLKPGNRVQVLEVRFTDERWRARLLQPSGWITLLKADGRSRWAHRVNNATNDMESDMSRAKD